MRDNRNVKKKNHPKLTPDGSLCAYVHFLLTRLNRIVPYNNLWSGSRTSARRTLKRKKEEQHSNENRE
jgi:hypothetical protein